MIIILKPDASEQDVKGILNKIEALQLEPLHMPGSERTVIGALGDERKLKQLYLENHPCVEQVKPVLSPYKLVSREFKSQDSQVKIDDVVIGGEEFVVIAGPCAVENELQMMTTAKAVKSSGALMLRGGAFKPRTSPYSFQGLGDEGARLLRKVSEEHKIPTVSELIDISHLDVMLENVSAMQIGARNMQNFALLKAVGETDKPVILKRGMSATIKELLLAAEYIVASGNPNVVICERGIRTFETATRNTLDLNAVAYIKEKSHLPVIVDPSHGTGVRSLVAPLAKAAAAVGADGVIVEVHYDPELALSDAKQSLSPEDFEQLMQQLRPFVAAAGRRCA